MVIVSGLRVVQFLFNETKENGFENSLGTLENGLNNNGILGLQIIQILNVLLIISHVGFQLQSAFKLKQISNSTFLRKEVSVEFGSVLFVSA